MGRILQFNLLIYMHIRLVNYGLERTRQPESINSLADRFFVPLLRVDTFADDEQVVRINLLL